MGRDPQQRYMAKITKYQTDEERREAKIELQRERREADKLAKAEEDPSKMINPVTGRLSTSLRLQKSELTGSVKGIVYERLNGTLSPSRLISMVA